MKPNSYIETGIALEVYIGEVANMNRINDVAARLFGEKLFNENRYLKTLATNIWLETKHLFKMFVQSPKSWSNITYNLHDAYCCFLISSDKDGKIKKDYTNWFWKPSPKAKGGSRSMNYTPFTKDGKHFRVSTKFSNTRFFSKNPSFNSIQPLYIHSFKASDNPNDNSWRLRRNVFVDRPNNVLGTVCADTLFRNYQPIHSKGFTLVFANAIYYSMFLESAVGSGKRKRISKDVISSFLTIASDIVTHYGDQSQNGVQVYFRKQIYKYRGVGNHLSVFSHGYPA